MFDSNYVKLITIAICFLISFSVYFSAYFILSQIYDQNNKQNLGQISIFLNYLSSGVFNLFVPMLLTKFKPNHLMIFGAIGLTIFPLTALFNVFCADGNNELAICYDVYIYISIAIGAILSGMMFAVLWVAQSKYVISISSKHNRGKYFGTFWAIYQISQVSGNILTLFLLEEFSHLQFFIILTVIALVSGALFFIIPAMEHKVHPQQEDQNLSPNSSIYEVIKMIASPEVRIYLPLFTLSGVIIGFQSGFLYKLCEESIEETDHHEINRKTTLMILILGVFEIIGGLISGQLLDRYNRYLVATVSTLIVQVSVIVSIVAMFEKNYTLVCVCSAFWGLSDCFTQNVITVLCSNFEKNISIFCVFRLAIGVTITMTLIIVLGNQPGYILLILIACMQMATNMSTLSLTDPQQSKSIKL